MLHRALEANASDIHAESFESSLSVRFRVDGVLEQAYTYPPSVKDAFVSRLKVMASLDIGERRRPQDGHFRFAHDGRAIDVRVSTLPTEHGEKVVLRLLDSDHIQLTLSDLGFEDADRSHFERAIAAPYGMVLVTGPTGSGKTTTLYAALRELATERVNVTTVEDPVEYRLPGINQSHVRADIGYTFAAALRAILRQDPDVIMVGEIRDTETAEIAVRAALTGHQVLSTLHTNDAPSTIARLLDMGVEPFLVASSLRLVVAQRLVRKVCTHCREEAPLPDALRRELGTETTTYVRGRGCTECRSTGYQGRLAIFEVLSITEALSERIAQRAGAGELRALAFQEGMRTLRQAALEKMHRGITTPEEVLRATML